MAQTNLTKWDSVTRWNSVFVLEWSNVYGIMRKFLETAWMDGVYIVGMHIAKVYVQKAHSKLFKLKGVVQVCKSKYSDFICQVSTLWV